MQNYLIAFDFQNNTRNPTCDSIIIIDDEITIPNYF